MATRASIGSNGTKKGATMEIRWDASIGEYVGRDLNDIEHFGQSQSECAARISEANEVIIKHRSSNAQRCPLCGEIEVPGHFERCAYEF